MSTITDYKVITYDFSGHSPKEGYEKITEFIDTVRKYLKKGYTLHGTTRNDGTHYVNHRFTQVVVKYSTPPVEPLIQDYKLVRFWCPHEYDGSSSLHLASFQNAVMDCIRDGWSLHGDIQYSKYESPHSQHHYSQALVKYKVPEPNLLDI